MRLRSGTITDAPPLRSISDFAAAIASRRTNVRINRRNDKNLTCKRHMDTIMATLKTWFDAHEDAMMHWRLEIVLAFHKTSDPTTKKTESFWLRSGDRLYIGYDATHRYTWLNEWAEETIELADEKYLNSLDEFGESGVVIDGVEQMVLHIDSHIPFFAGSWIQTPSKLTRRCINIDPAGQEEGEQREHLRSQDQQCLSWCIAACLFMLAKGKPAKPNRATNYALKHGRRAVRNDDGTYIPATPDNVPLELGQELPIPIHNQRQTRKVLNELETRVQLSINMYIYRSGHVLPWATNSPTDGSLPECNLIFIPNGEYGHFVLGNEHYLTRDDKQGDPCRNCCLTMKTNAMAHHRTICKPGAAQEAVMPAPFQNLTYTFDGEEHDLTVDDDVEWMCPDGAAVHAKHRVGTVAVPSAPSTSPKREKVLCDIIAPGNGVLRHNPPRIDPCTLQFRKWKARVQSPVFLSADFEAYPNQVHTPASWACQVVVAPEHERVFGDIQKDYMSKHSSTSTYLELMKSFYETQLTIADSVLSRMQLHRSTKSMIITKEEEKEYEDAQTCHICCKPLNGDSVPDHNHTNGRYRGAAHAKCNISTQLMMQLACYFWNGSRYDHQFLLQSASIAHDVAKNHVHKVTIPTSLAPTKIIIAKPFKKAQQETTPWKIGDVVEHADRLVHIEYDNTTLALLSPVKGKIVHIENGVSHIQRSNGTIRQVALPPIGQLKLSLPKRTKSRVEKGDKLATLYSGDIAAEIIAPLSGVLTPAMHDNVLFKICNVEVTYPTTEPKEIRVAPRPSKKKSEEYKPGDDVKKGDTVVFLKVPGQKGTLHLVAPVSGKITAVNPSDGVLLEIAATLEGDPLKDISGIGGEAVLSLTYGSTKFVDSYRMLDCSLAASVKNLSDAELELVVADIMHHYPHLQAEEACQLAKGKGVFPYTWFDGPDKLDEKRMPSKLEFKDQLSNRHITQADYEQAKRAWDLLGCRTFKDYHDFYLHLDVWLQSACLTAASNAFYKYFGLDMTQHVTLGQLGWNAMLFQKTDPVELLKDEADYHDITKAKRGGLSGCLSRRHARANHKRLVTGRFGGCRIGISKKEFEELCLSHITLVPSCKEKCDKKPRKTITIEGKTILEKCDEKTRKLCQDRMTITIDPVYEVSDTHDNKVGEIEMEEFVWSEALLNEPYDAKRLNDHFKLDLPDEVIIKESDRYLVHAGRFHKHIEWFEKNGIELNTITTDWKDGIDLKVTSFYHPDRQIAIILYLDINSMYPTIMRNDLPCSHYRWLDLESDQDKRAFLDGIIEGVPEGVGHLVVCDIVCPPEIHDKVSNFTPLPELKTMPYEKHSEWYRSQVTEKQHAKTPKLYADLTDKEFYALDSRLLRFVMNLGYKVTKLHRVMQWSEKPYMRGFVDECASRRRECVKNDDKTGSNLNKLVQNSCYGKTLQDAYRYSKSQRVMIVDGEESTSHHVRKHQMNPFTSSTTILRSDEEVAADPTGGPAAMLITENKGKVNLNRPIPGGIVILDRSKLMFGDMYYNRLVKEFQEKINTGYSDTDSVIATITTDDHDYDHHAALRRIQNDPERGPLFDWANLDKDHPLYDERYRKQLGLLSDETDGVPILELVALRAKCYSLRMISFDGIQKFKGAPKRSVADQLGHEDYRRCLIANDGSTTVQANRIGSQKHQLGTFVATKAGLRNTDDKRYLLDDGITTLPHGHWRTTKDFLPCQVPTSNS